MTLAKKILFFLAISSLSVGLFIFAFYKYGTGRSKATFDTGSVYAPKLKQHQVEVDVVMSENATTVRALIFLENPELENKVNSKEKSEKSDERKKLNYELKLKTTVIQQRILSSVQDLIDKGNLKVKRSFYIDNIIVADLDKEAISTLATTPGILKIIPDYQIVLSPMTAVASGTPEWNISKIQADRVWNELGITGQGVTVANIDTGVQWDHPALKQKYRGFDTSTGLVNHDYNWYDPSGTYKSVPLDDGGHGTHTMGIVVGSEGDNNIGVAPGAKWIAAKGCVVNGCSASDLIAAGQWMLAPTKIDGTESDPSKAPDVINNSWSGGTCNTWYQGVIQAWINAGIVPVFSAGNNGPNANTINTPGDNPEAFSVGAVDSSDNIASFSSRGPACSSFNDIIKPDVSAPGVAIRSSIPYDSYLNLQGTSMASPHVAGVIALLLQKNPILTVYQIEQILRLSATDLGNSGMDNIFGSGLINAYKAMQIDVGIIPSPTPTTPMASIRVISPNGGEQLQNGQAFRITWDSTSINNVTLELESLNGTTTGMVFGIPNIGYYDWTVSKPASQTGTQFKIIVRGDGNTYSIYDASDNYFSIITPTPTPVPTLYIKITSPNGGEKYAVGEQHRVLWESNPQIKKVIIILRSMNGISRYLTYLTNNLGYFDWIVPEPNEYQINYLIDILGLAQTPNGDLYSSDLSDDYFQIGYPPTPTPTSIPTPTPTPTNTPTPTPTLIGCKNNCGNGICEVNVCLALGCACPEDIISCSQDCGSVATPSQKPTPVSRPSTIDIYAYGTQSSRVYPRMDLIINGRLLKRWENVNKNSFFNPYKKYSYIYSRKLIAGDEVAVGYSNDDNTGNNNGSRNLRIDKIVIDEKIYQTEATTVYSSGTWYNSANKCLSRYAKSEWLNCNGSFTYLLN